MKMRNRSHISVSTRQSTKRLVVVGASLSLVIVLACYLVINLGNNQETLAAALKKTKSEKSGNWNVGNSWQNNTVPNASDDFEIDGTIIKSGDLTIGNHQSLTINKGDTLVVAGDLLLQNQAVLLINQDAALIVRGNYTSHQKTSDAVQGGVLIIMGKLTFSGGGADILNGAGSTIYYDQTLNNPTYVNSHINGSGFVKGINNIPNTLFEAAYGQTLPVTVTNFRGEVEGKEVLLSWKAALESGVSYYQVEKSKDAKVFEKIGTIEALGESMEEINYEWVDGVSGGNVYYRLSNVDFEGNVEYHGIAVVSSAANTSSELSLFPSVTLGHDINFTASDIQNKSVKIMVFDIAGRTVMSDKIQTNGEESQTITFPEKLGKGNYYIHFVYDNKVSKQKFMVSE